MSIKNDIIFNIEAHIMAKNLDYIAIDFETANSKPTSACSIGLVGVVNDKVVLEEYYLINPQEEFNPYNIEIHHILPSDVEGEDTFDKVWEKIKGYFNDTTVISHNAMFDFWVLKSLIEKYNLERPNIKIACTLKISEKVWKEGLPNHKLGTISKYLEVEHNYHNALSDAYICTEIIKRSEIITNTSCLDEVMESLGLLYGRYNNERFYLPKTRFRKINKDAPSNYFKGKVVSIVGKPLSLTKKKVFEILEIKGAIINNGVDRSTDVVIIFNGAKKSDLIALSKVKESHEVKEINEEEFLKLTNE